MRRLALAAAVLIALPLAAAPAAPGVGTVTTLSAPRRKRFEAAALADVNGDGALDLVLSLSRRGQGFERSLAVHLRVKGAAAFRPEPDHVLDLTPDVVAFAPADVAVGGGKEVVLFTATGAFGWRPGAPDSERPRKLVTAEFLWSLPHPRAVFAWNDGVLDLDGDGLDDLFLPLPDGYQLALQRRDAEGVHFDVSSELTLPTVSDAPPARGERRRRGRERGRKFRIALGVGAAPESTHLVAVSESVPAPAFLDWDGDGDRDVLAHTTSQLLVWLQDAEGRFQQAPSQRELLPLDVDRSRRLDVSFGLHAAELDGDGRADCVLLAGDRRSDDPRTQVMVFRHDAGGAGAVPLFTDEGVPDQALFVGGFAGRPGLEDVNGDGTPDLILATVQVDAIDALRAAASGTLDAQLAIYIAVRGKYPRRPSASLTLPIEAKAFRRARNLLARFFGDATGNGARDLLVRDDPERLRVFPTRRSRTGVTVGDDAIFETRIGDDAEITIVDQAPDGGPELIAVDNESILHVSFR